MSADPVAVAWRPDPAFVEAANWTAFIRAMDEADYAGLAARAAADPAWFWEGLIRFLDIRFSRPFDKVLDAGDGPAWVKWCVGGRMNVCQTLIERNLEQGRADHPAIVWEGEDGTVRTVTYAALADEAARAAAGLRALGLRPGDPVGLYMPMVPEAVVAFVALARLGCVVLPLFSGFGAEALAVRMKDGGAVACITADGCLRRGRAVAMKSVVDEAAAAVPSLRHVVTVRRLGAKAPPYGEMPGRDTDWDSLVSGSREIGPPVELDAEAPLMTVYTSGTTGRPKGTVHTHCGFLTKTGEDFALCFDLKPADRLLWMTDIGWLVGPIQITATLMRGATLVLAEGTPDYPEPGRLWRLVQDHRVSFLGVGSTVARLLMRHGRDGVAKYDLSSLRVAASTGEPWDHDSWRWIFDCVLGGARPLMNYSGGTEMGGLLATNPLFPIKPASFNGPIPGTNADIVNDAGNPVGSGEVGELVMRGPCIGLTKGLLHDPERYIDNYWSRFPGIWVHGDWASRDADGYWYVHGRSDDTIKLAGKRTGPAEIESLALSTGLVSDAAAVAVPDPVKGSAVVLVAVPAPGVAGDEAAAAAREAIARGFGHAFRPERVLCVADLPKTRNMKTMRRVIRAALTGEAQGDLSALVNPEAVEAIRAAAGARP